MAQVGAPSAVPVLVVDDSAQFRQATRAVLERVSGFELIGEAESGEEGEAMVETLAPSLVLMDINMGGMSGIEATRRITRQHPDIMVILLSTYQADDLPVDVLESGAAAYVHKEDLSGRVLRRLWEESGHPAT